MAEAKAEAQAEQRMEVKRAAKKAESKLNQGIVTACRWVLRAAIKNATAGRRSLPKGNTNEDFCNC